MNRLKNNPGVYLWLCLLFYLAFVLSLISVATDDIRLAGVFSIDESQIATEVRYLYRAGFTAKPSFKYGGGFYYIPLLFLNIWSVVGDVNDRVILLTLRMFCAVAGIGSIWLTYRIGSVVWDNSIGLIGAFLLLGTPTFLRWTVEIHPDLPQLFWMLCALLYCCRLCRVYQLKSILLASMFAGFAFGTKYAGGFLIPIIALSVLLLSVSGNLNPISGLKRLKKGRYLVGLGSIPVVFALTFVAINPHTLIEFEAFRNNLLSEKQIMSFGHWFHEESSWVEWFSVLKGTIGTLNGLIFVGCIILGAWFECHRLIGSRRMLLVWIVLFMSYLMLEVNVRKSRHLLPVVPCVLLFVATGYQRIFRIISDWVLNFPARSLFLIAVVIFLSWENLVGSFNLFEIKRTREQGRQELVVGKWLIEKFSKETTILYDAYAYIPSQFRNVCKTIGQNYQMVNHFEPDLIVIRKAIENDYKDRENAYKARIGEIPFLDCHFFYRYIREGLIPTYRLVKNFGTMAVYGRIEPRREQSVGDPGRQWKKLMVYFNQDQIYGMVSALWTIGTIHLSMGLTEEAERAFDRAKAGKNFLLRAYNHGLQELTAGRISGTVSAFKAIQKSIEAKPNHFRANLQEEFSLRYLQAGYYGQSITHAVAALRLNPDLKMAVYQLAVAYLGEGRIQKADSLFFRASARYGPDAEGAELLRNLVRKGLLVDEGQQILNVYFKSEIRKNTENSGF